jgi:hypothetical protein
MIMYLGFQVYDYEGFPSRIQHLTTSHKRRTFPQLRHQETAYKEQGLKKAPTEKKGRNQN